MLKTCLLTLFIKSDKSLNKSLKVGDATNECLILWDFCYLFWYAPTMSLVSEVVLKCLSGGDFVWKSASCNSAAGMSKWSDSGGVCLISKRGPCLMWQTSKWSSCCERPNDLMDVCLWVRIQRKYLFLPPEWIKWVIIFFKKKEILKTFWLIIQCNTVAFFCCNQTALKFNILYAQKCSSVYIGYKWLFELLLISYQLKEVWRFSSDLCH